MDFEPEHWLKLARANPEEFERARKAAVQILIASAPPVMQDRLRGLQCRIDLERRKAKTPLGAAIRLHTLMWDRFQTLSAALNDLKNADMCGALEAPKPTASAAVIPFVRTRPCDAGEDVVPRLPLG